MDLEFDEEPETQEALSLSDGVRELEEDDGLQLVFVGEARPDAVPAVFKIPAGVGATVGRAKSCSPVSV